MRNLAADRTPEPLAVVNVRERQNFVTPKQWNHPYHCISLILRGHGYYRSGPVELPADRPLFIFLPAQDDDVDGFVGPVVSWYAGFNWPGLRIKRPTPLELELAWNGRSYRVPRYRVLDSAAGAKMDDQYTTLAAALARQDLPGMVLARALLMQLVVSYADSPGGPFASRALARFHALLQENACGDESIEQLAAQAGISANHARTLFLERFGARPVEYRTGLRLAKARELLSSTMLNIKEVARQIGYPDALYFSRVFKAHFGISPREMIHRHRLTSGGR